MAIARAKGFGSETNYWITVGTRKGEMSATSDNDLWYKKFGEWICGLLIARLHDIQMVVGFSPVRFIKFNFRQILFSKF